MSFGTIFQLVGAVIALILAFTGHALGAGIAFGVHFAGDAIVGFLKPLDFVANLEKSALRFVKLRGFMIGVAWALSGMSFFWNFHTKLLFIPITSWGVFFTMWMVLLVGFFVYDQWYT